jgi:hypothetical protein
MVRTVGSSTSRASLISWGDAPRSSRLLEEIAHGHHQLRTAQLMVAPQFFVGDGGHPIPEGILRASLGPFGAKVAIVERLGGLSHTTAGMDPVGNGGDRHFIRGNSAQRLPNISRDTAPWSWLTPFTKVAVLMASTAMLKGVISRPYPLDLGLETHRPIGQSAGHSDPGSRAPCRPQTDQCQRGPGCGW